MSISTPTNFFNNFTPHEMAFIGILGYASAITLYNYINNTISPCSGPGLATCPGCTGISPNVVCEVVGIFEDTPLSLTNIQSLHLRNSTFRLLFLSDGNNVILNEVVVKRGLRITNLTTLTATEVYSTGSDNGNGCLPGLQLDTITGPASVEGMFIGGNAGGPDYGCDGIHAFAVPNLHVTGYSHGGDGSLGGGNGIYVDHSVDQVLLVDGDSYSGSGPLDDLDTPENNDHAHGILVTTNSASDQEVTVNGDSRGDITGITVRNLLEDVNTTQTVVVNGDTQGFVGLNVTTASVVSYQDVTVNGDTKGFYSEDIDGFLSQFFIGGIFLNQGVFPSIAGAPGNVGLQSLSVNGTTSGFVGIGMVGSDSDQSLEIDGDVHSFIGVAMNGFSQDLEVNGNLHGSELATLLFGIQNQRFSIVGETHGSILINTFDFGNTQQSGTIVGDVHGNIGLISYHADQTLNVTGDVWSISLAVYGGFSGQGHQTVNMNGNVHSINQTSSIFGPFGSAFGQGIRFRVEFSEIQTLNLNGNVEVESGNAVSFECEEFCEQIFTIYGNLQSHLNGSALYLNVLTDSYQHGIMEGNLEGDYGLYAHGSDYGQDFEYKGIINAEIDGVHLDLVGESDFQRFRTLDFDFTDTDLEELFEFLFENGNLNTTIINARDHGIWAHVDAGQQDFDLLGVVIVSENNGVVIESSGESADQSLGIFGSISATGFFDSEHLAVSMRARNNASQRMFVFSLYGSTGSIEMEALENSQQRGILYGLFHAEYIGMSAQDNMNQLFVLLGDVHALVYVTGGDFGQQLVQIYGNVHSPFFGGSIIVGPAPIAPAGVRTATLPVDDDVGVTVTAGSNVQQQVEIEGSVQLEGRNIARTLAPATAPVFPGYDDAILVRAENNVTQIVQVYGIVTTGTNGAIHVVALDFSTQSFQAGGQFNADEYGIKVEIGAAGVQRLRGDGSIEVGEDGIDVEAGPGAAQQLSWEGTIVTYDGDGVTADVGPNSNQDISLEVTVIVNNEEGGDCVHIYGDANVTQTVNVEGRCVSTHHGVHVETNRESTQTVSAMGSYHCLDSAFIAEIDEEDDNGDGSQNINLNGDFSSTSDDGPAVDISIDGSGPQVITIIGKVFSQSEDGIYVEVDGDQTVVLDVEAQGTHAIHLLGDGPKNVTGTTYLKGEEHGLYITGDGDVTVTLTGEFLGGTEYGVGVLGAGVKQVSLNGLIMGDQYGVLIGDPENEDPESGDAELVTNGLIFSLEGAGVSISKNGTKSFSGTGDIYGGGDDGIHVEGPGAITVTQNGNIYSEEDGVDTDTDSATTITVNGDVHAERDGFESESETSVVITSNGDVYADDDAFDLEGDGSKTVTHNGNVYAGDNGFEFSNGGNQTVTMTGNLYAGSGEDSDGHGATMSGDGDKSFELDGLLHAKGNGVEMTGDGAKNVDLGDDVHAGANLYHHD